MIDRPPGRPRPRAAVRDHRPAVADRIEIDLDELRARAQRRHLRHDFGERRRTAWRSRRHVLTCGLRAINSAFDHIPAQALPESSTVLAWFASPKADV
jgi:hypothetical protein